MKEKESLLKILDERIDKLLESKKIDIDSKLLQIKTIINKKVKKMRQLRTITVLLILSTSLFAQKDWNWGKYGDSTFFPIATHLQAIRDIDANKAIGINVYSGFWSGLSERSLSVLRSKKMYYIAGWEKPSNREPDLVARANIDDSLFIAWRQKDEPDNAQSDGNGGYLSCIDPQIIIDKYDEIKSFDTTGRQVILNCGAGVARTDAYIRGSECAGNTAMYTDYFKGADIASFDIYPVSSPPSPMKTNDELWYVGEGVRNMREWTNDSKDAYWFYLECTDIKGEGKPTPEQIWIEAWSGIIAGGTGIIWFPYTVYPNVHNPRALLEDPEMMEAVKKVNSSVRDLAVAINSKTINDAVDLEVLTSNPWEAPKIKVDYMVKKIDDTLYIFTAGGVGENPNTATFTINDSLSFGAKVEVMYEDREIEIIDNKFTQEYNGQEVHLFKIVGVTVGLENETSKVVSEYSLEQNYPNPFNPTTVINYSLPKSSHVLITIYDVLGQKIKELVNKEMKGGRHKVDFNAFNLGSGLYFYTMQAGHFNVTKKMLLIR